MLAGVLLAGGLSTRMGKDKAQLQSSKSGLTLLQQAKKLLMLISPQQILLSSNQSPAGIKDIFPQCGPLSGIHASCVTIRQQFPELTEAIFIPVDMPYLNQDDLLNLIQCGREQQRPCCYTHCYLPLYLPVNFLAVEYLNNTLLAEENYSLKKMLKSLNGLQITPRDSQHLININAPHEWQEFELHDQQN